MKACAAVCSAFSEEAAFFLTARREAKIFTHTLKAATAFRTFAADDEGLQNQPGLSLLCDSEEANEC